MLSSSLDTLLKVTKTTSPQKLLAYDCVTMYFLSYKCLTKAKNKAAVISDTNGTNQNKIK